MIVILIGEEVEDNRQKNTGLLFAFLRKMIENLKKIQSVLNVIDRFFVDFVFLFIFALKILIDHSIGALFLTGLDGIALLNPVEFLAQDRPKIGMANMFQSFLSVRTDEIDADGPQWCEIRTHPHREDSTAIDGKTRQPCYWEGSPQITSWGK